MLTNAHPISRVLLSATLIGALVGGACGGGGETEDARLEPDDIPAIAEGMTDDAASLARVEEIVDIGADAIPVLVDLADEDTEAERYIAVAALGRIAVDLDRAEGTTDSAVAAEIDRAAGALAERLDDPSPSLRVYAAGALTALGRQEGIPVLIEHLTTAERGAFTEPPELLNAFADATLEAYLPDGPAFDPYADTTALAAGQQQWRAWWQEHGDALTWDAASRTFEVAE